MKYIYCQLSCGKTISKLFKLQMNCMASHHILEMRITLSLVNFGHPKVYSTWFSMWKTHVMFLFPKVTLDLLSFSVLTDIICLPMISYGNLACFWVRPFGISRVLENSNPCTHNITTSSNGKDKVYNWQEV